MTVETRQTALTATTHLSQSFAIKALMPINVSTPIISKIVQLYKHFPGVMFWNSKLVGAGLSREKDLWSHEMGVQEGKQIGM